VHAPILGIASESTRHWRQITGVELPLLQGIRRRSGRRRGVDEDRRGLGRRSPSGTPNGFVLRVGYVIHLLGRPVDSTLPPIK